VLGERHRPLDAPWFLQKLSAVPIYEFACPRCRRIFSFLARKVSPSHSPACPKCGSRKLSREISRFAMIKGVAEPAAPGGEGPDDGLPMPNLDDPRVARALSDMERDMDHLDENNPRHMAHLLRKMKDVLPSGSMPKEFEVAIKRLEAGEDPEKIEADMGDVLGGLLGEGEGDEQGPGGSRGGGGAYSKDPGLYDY
jgi:putative FmdB family regulatory protein